VGGLRRNGEPSVSFTCRRPLTEGNQEVQTLAPDRFHQPFAVGGSRSLHSGALRLIKRRWPSEPQLVPERNCWVAAKVPLCRYGKSVNQQAVAFGWRSLIPIEERCKSRRERQVSNDRKIQ
jgi:hypothetical protein